MNEHRWERKENYGHGHSDKCSVCKCSRHYSWTPGWPGSYVYFNRDGDYANKTNHETEPGCTELPVEGLFG